MASTRTAQEKSSETRGFMVMMLTAWQAMVTTAAASIRFAL